METAMEKCIWKELRCFQEKICIMLPQEWERPSDRMLERKFPYHMRPQEIFADAQADRILTLNILDKQLEEKQVYPAVRGIQRVISRIYPESVREQAKNIKTKAGMTGFFSFITGGIKEDTYHSMFILPVDEKMLFGSFHLPEGQTQEGKKILLDIINSIQINREGDTNEGISDQNRTI